MVKRWVRKWSPEVKPGLMPDVEVISVQPSAIEKMTWRLPPSKSHFIRFLAFAALGHQNIRLSNVEYAGHDVQSMIRCLRQLGIVIERVNNDGGSVLNVKGKGHSSFTVPSSVLHCGNSGLSFRILTLMCATMDQPVMLDGDESLRQRPHDELINLLHQFKVDTSYGHGKEALPLLIHGPVTIPESTVEIAVNKTSQALTGLIIASSQFISPVNITLVGQSVSRSHAELTHAMMLQLGGMGQFDYDMTLMPFTPHFEEEDIEIPADASMLSFAMLACQTTHAPVNIVNFPNESDSIGHDILIKHFSELGFERDSDQVRYLENGSPVELDLTNANDLLPPLACMLALGQGGALIGFGHARFKESDRVQRTFDVMKDFGLIARLVDNKIVIDGGQSLSTPTRVVKTYDDHRIQLTAIHLALGCDSRVMVEGKETYAVVDEYAIQRLIDHGIKIETTVIPSTMASKMMV